MRTPFLKRSDVHLEKNLKELEKLSPRLAKRLRDAESAGNVSVVASKAGPPSIKVGDSLLHSVYDPLREAREWVEHHRAEIESSSSIAVLGVGLGYHIEELLRVTDKLVIAFDPRIDVLLAASRVRDLSALFSRVSVACCLDDLESPSGGMFGVLRHEPSVRLDPAAHEEAVFRLETLQAVARGLNIAVVGPFYGGSLPIAGYCVSALRNLGHNVEFIDNSVFGETFLSIDKTTDKMKEFVSFVSEAAMARIVPFRPDIVLALAQALLLPASLNILRERGIATAFWFVEDFRHMEYWRDYAGKYDYFFAIQKGGFLDMLREAGASHPAFLPLAASPDVHRTLELDAEDLAEFGSEVSFVGAGYHNRRRLFRGLVDLDFRIWGNGWDGCPELLPFLQRDGVRVDTEDIVKVFNASRININLHSSTYHEGVNPDGDFVNPRTFEIAACGAFQLVDPRSGLSDFFQIGEEIACFDSLADLRAKIAWYLENPEERKAIARRGMLRVQSEHTYERRMEEMIGFMVRSGLRPPWREERKREDPERLIAEAGADTELGKYLARFAGERGLKLVDIIRDIKKGSGDLSRVERIFLAMEAFREWVRK
ncbi:MAG: glycosyltransferase [Syntrophorhabdaceae bacterium]|nr:glycosyltransferase [Syntrophorhabdaceae bacterium]